MKFLPFLQLIDESILNDVVKKYELKEIDKKFLEAVDPGGKLFQNKFTNWLAKKIYLGSKFVDEKYHVSEDSKKFFDNTVEQWQTMFKFFKGFGIPIETVSIDDFFSKTQVSFEKSKAMNQFEIIYEDKNLKLVLLKGPIGARYLYGAKAKWCIASSSAEKHFPKYTQGLATFVVAETKYEKPLDYLAMRFNWNGTKWNDVHDSINYKDGLDAKDIRNQIFAKHKKILSEAITRYNQPKVDDINLMSENDKMDMIREDGLDIQFIKNPSDDMQMAAIVQNPESFRMIKNPSEKIQEYAIKILPDLIKYIPNPSENIQNVALRENPLYIMHIKNPSEKVQMYVVERNPNSIRFINDPSDKVQLHAVSHFPIAIDYIDEPSEAVQLEAVIKDPLIIGNIDHPTLKVQIAAITLDKNSKVVNGRHGYINSSRLDPLAKEYAEKILDYRHLFKMGTMTAQQERTMKALKVELNETLKKVGLKGSI